MMRKEQLKHSTVSPTYLLNLKLRLARKHSRNCLSFEACPTLAVCFVWGCFHCLIELMQAVVSQIPVFAENDVGTYMQLSAKFEPFA